MNENLAAENIDLARLVAVQVWKSLSSAADLDEMIGDANLGLVKASRSFDPARGIKFRTFAQYRVRGAVMDGLRDRMIHSRWCQVMRRQMEDVEAELAQRFKRHPESDEVAEAMGLAMDDYHKLRSATSLEVVSSETIPGFADMVSDGRVEIPESCTQMESIERCIAMLRGDDRRIIRLYFYEGKTQDEIGAMIGVTRGRVSQIVRAIVARMRYRMRSDCCKNYSTVSV